MGYKRRLFASCAFRLVMAEDILSRLDPAMCVRCKASKGLCGISPCPLLQTVRSKMPTTAPVGKEFQGTSPPSLFVGRYGYPKVQVGPMLSASLLSGAQAQELDQPGSWMDTHSIAEVVGLRSSVVRTQHAVDVHAAQDPDRITRVAQELALLPRHADTEVRLSKALGVNLTHVGQFTMPHGPTAEVEQAMLTENVSPIQKLQQAADDLDWKASDAVANLYDRGVDAYALERAMSAGVLGLGKSRRFVPTRWAITATDDTLGKHLVDEVRDLPSIAEPLYLEGDGFGNHFKILLLPGPWGFDYIEAWGKGSFWHLGTATRTELTVSNDWEGPEGRSQYASETAGGYYAARLPILEWMVRYKRRATAIVIREITDAYTTPLGVWVVRESCRRATQAKALPFGDVESGLRHLDRRTHVANWREQMGYLDRFLAQATLDRFL